MRNRLDKTCPITMQSTSTELQAAFDQTFGKFSPSNPLQACVAVQLLETPLGTLLVGAVSDGVCLLEYLDRDKLAQRSAQLRQQFGYPVLSVPHFHLDRLKDELAQYFAGTLTQFTVPVWLHGTPFQKRVWTELQRISYGHTIAYEDLAHRMGQPTAIRAVARANSMNRVYLLVPCHRVIGKNGQLTGYAGGLWRKRWLLELEQPGQLSLRLTTH